MKTATGLLVLVAAIALAGCGETAQDRAANQARQAAHNNNFYVPTHRLEQQNYNDRQRLSDDPATIVWCTFFPPTVGQEPITVPIAGKLTSSGKRPIARYRADSTENVGADGMYGDSSEYRYGFDPTRAVYYDFTSLPSICTNAPLVWQLNQTRIVTQTAAGLESLTTAAESALRKGDAKKAAELLHQAEGKAK